MDKQQVEDILYCLKGERTLFPYARDTYALQLLRDYIGHGMAISQLRQSPYASFLQKPLVKQALALAGKGLLKPDHLEWVQWQTNQLQFVLTLDQWGTEKPSERQWRQLSRTGYHLVLQLNFANDHQQQYQRWIKPVDKAEFSYWCHPVVTQSKYETLAWARIDIDFASDQALIEEIQTDWVRQVKELKHSWRYGEENIRAYQEQVLKPYAKLWDEATLAAAIHLIRHDLGIKQVFYHSFETGNALKGIRSTTLPPRSLYTDLPQRFAFDLTSEVPVFLRDLRHTKRILHELGDQARWFKLP